jgi:hypothetical protein
MPKILQEYLHDNQEHLQDKFCQMEWDKFKNFVNIQYRLKIQNNNS